MVAFGRLIQKIRRHHAQKNRSLFFLSENVPIRNEQDMPLQLGDLELTKDAYGIEWDPYELDAKYCSPCHRRRQFFANIPLEIEEGFFKSLDATGSTPTATRCLRDGYRLPPHWLEEAMFAKFPTFMASVGRMDDERMLVFKKRYSFFSMFGSTEYEMLAHSVFYATALFLNRSNSRVAFTGRSISISEREVAMGYQEGYVSKPVQALFEALLHDGLGMISQAQPHWSQKLDQKYHRFAGAYHDLPESYRLFRDGDAVLKMSPPAGSAARPTFFDAEGYSKHLVGNAYSVPVVETLLQPLKKVFVQRSYQNYQYTYQWEES